MKVKSLGGKLLEKWDDVMRNAQLRRGYETGNNGSGSGRELLLGGGASRSPWRFSTSYRESLASPTALSAGVLSCVPLGKRSSGGGSTMVTVLVGKERQPFRVEPQILDHGVVQWLLQWTQQRQQQQQQVGGELFRSDLRTAGESVLEDIRLDCDAILFEHILWLLYNDDPAIRNLNLDELIEFYGGFD